MNKNNPRRLEFLPEGVVFEAVLDLADALGIPAKTENYDLLAAVTADRVHLTGATSGWRQAPAHGRYLEKVNGIKSQRLQRFLRRLYSLISGHQAPEEEPHPGQRGERLNNSPFNRTLKDIPNDDLRQAIEKLATGLKIPIRGEGYDLMEVILDEQAKDQKASE